MTTDVERDWTLCRRVDETTALGSRVVLLNPVGGFASYGSLRGCSATKATVAPHGGKSAMRTTMAPFMVRRMPMTWVEERPVYEGDTLYAHWTNLPPCPVTVTYADGVRIGNIVPEEYTARHGVDSGASAPAVYSWQPRAGWGDRHAPQDMQPPTRDMFINLYRSLPKGQRYIPGTDVFPSAEQAQAKATRTTLVGTFKLVPA